MNSDIKGNELEFLHQQCEELKRRRQEFYAHYKHVEKMVGGLSFSTALDALKHGLAISRKGWNGKGLFVTLFIDDLGYFALIGLQKMLLLHYPNGITYSWVPSISDLLAEDWEVSLYEQ